MEHLLEVTTNTDIAAKQTRDSPDTFSPDQDAIEQTREIMKESFMKRLDLPYAPLWLRLIGILAILGGILVFSLLLTDVWTPGKGQGTIASAGICLIISGIMIGFGLLPTTLIITGYFILLAGIILLGVGGSMS